MISIAMILDFGDFVPGGGKSGNDKRELEERVLDVSLNKAFTLDLNTNFPSKIADWNISLPNVDAQ